MEEKRVTVRAILSNPWVGALGLLVSLLGIGLSVYLYLLSERHRDLVVYTNAGSVIVDRTNSGSLTVLADGKKVGGNVSLVEVYFWNDGRESIKSQDILQPFEISFPQGNRIIEARRRLVSRPVTNISFDRSRLQQGKLGVTWAILEENDGAAIQIIFEGSPSDRPSAHGIIEGQGNARVIPRLRDSVFGWVAPLAFLLGVLPPVLFGIPIWRDIRKRKMPIKWICLPIGMFTVAIIFMGILTFGTKAELDLPKPPSWIQR